MRARTKKFVGSSNVAMPKAAPTASRVAAGGYSARYEPGDKTATGRDRSSARWCTTAARVASELLHQELHLQQQSDGSMSLHKVLHQWLDSKPTRERALSSPIARHALPSDVVLIRTILDDKADKLALLPEADKAPMVKLTWARIRHHAGPPAALPGAEAPPVDPAAVARGGEAWLDTAPTAGRPAPKPGSRLAKGMVSWEVDRLGDIPDDSVVVFERAQGRVRYAGDDAPSGKLLGALVHTDKIPTAVASAGDHFWLPALGRWASPSEVMRLFAVPTDSNLWLAVLRQAPPKGLTPRQVVQGFGKAVHVESAARAVRRAKEMADLGGPGFLTYGSACTGYDLIAQGALSVFPTTFRHRFASELQVTAEQQKTAALLAEAWGPHGLTAENIFADACSPEACVRAPWVHIWVCTPPCEAYSRRNHCPSEERARAEMALFDKMLNYVRAKQPRAIIIENVDEPSSRACIESALASLDGYVGESFVTKASDAGRMERVRRFWVLAHTRRERRCY